MDRYLRRGLRSGVVLFLAAGLVGCGGGGGGNGGGDRDTETTTTASTAPSTTTSTTASEEPFPTPTTETPTPTTESPGPTRDRPVLSLPRLPIGGDPETDGDDPARQCVDISWIPTTSANPVIPPGYAVEITDVVFSAAGFEVVESGCGSSRPNCVGHVIRAGPDTCDLAVRALPDADPWATVEVGLKGTLHCPESAGLTRCQEFADAVADEPGVTIELNQAPEPTTDTGTDTPTETGTGTGTQSSTPAETETGTGTSTGSGG